MILLPALLALAVMPSLSLGQAQSGVTLASLRHDYRPLLVFAASDNEVLREQVKLLSEHLEEMQERQVLVVPIVFKAGQNGEWKSGLPEGSVAWLTPEEETAARKRFRVGEEEFAVVLIGKDGGEKLRSPNPVTMDRVMKVIDAMPMRQKEVRDGHTG
jgi:hypothetical protein